MASSDFMDCKNEFQKRRKGFERKVEGECGADSELAVERHVGCRALGM